MGPEQLAEFVGATPDDAEYVASCWAEAVEAVNGFIGTETARGKVPAGSRDRCYLTAGSELFHTRNAPQGVSQFASFDGAPVRVRVDPLVPVYPLLKNHLVMGL